MDRMGNLLSRVGEPFYVYKTRFDDGSWWYFLSYFISLRSTQRQPEEVHVLVAQKNSASAGENFLGNFHSSLHNGGLWGSANNAQFFHAIDKIALHALDKRRKRKQALNFDKQNTYVRCCWLDISHSLPPDSAKLCTWQHWKVLFCSADDEGFDECAWFICMRQSRSSL